MKNKIIILLIIILIFIFGTTLVVVLKENNNKEKEDITTTTSTTTTHNVNHLTNEEILNRLEIYNEEGYELAIVKEDDKTKTIERKILITGEIDIRWTFDIETHEFKLEPVRPPNHTGGSGE